MPNDIPFYVIAAVTLIFAVAAMTQRNLVHCALCAAGAFASLAMIYLLLDAEFVGFAQLLVYVGAVAILVVFAILLTRVVATEAPPNWLSGVMAAAFVFAGIALPILASPGLRRAAPGPMAAPVKSIGEQLMGRYVLPLEMVGVLLTAALLGAAVIAMRDESGIQLPSSRRRHQREVKLR
jgi:NADH-quinone oxidoreductase subunit J